MTIISRVYRAAPIDRVCGYHGCRQRAMGIQNQTRELPRYICSEHLALLTRHPELFHWKELVSDDYNK